MNALRFRSILLFAFASVALSADAVDAYSNLGTAPNVYQSGVAYFVSPASIPAIGFQFTATATGTLSGIQAGANDIGFSHPFTINIYADSGQDTYGSLLASYTGASSGVSFLSTSSTLVSLSVNGPLLTTGSKYWFTTTTSSFTNQMAWNDSLSSQGLENRNGTYTTGTQGAFALQVNPVPEPATFAAFGLGAVAVLRRRRRGL